MAKYGKIYPVSFGFAWGLINGLGWMLLTWASARWGMYKSVVDMAEHVYHGLAPTFVGGLWAFLWGFLHFFVFALLAAVVYNWSTKCFCPAGQCD